MEGTQKKFNFFRYLVCYWSTSLVIYSRGRLEEMILWCCQKRKALVQIMQGLKWVLTSVFWQNFTFKPQGKSVKRYPPSVFYTSFQIKLIYHIGRDEVIKLTFGFICDQKTSEEGVLPFVSIFPEEKCKHIWSSLSPARFVGLAAAHSVCCFYL